MEEKNKCELTSPCTKATFNTAQQAHTVADMMNKRYKGNNSNRRKLRVYKCEMCNKFHTTSQTNKRRKRS